MDRRRNRKNARGSTKSKIRQHLVFWGSIGLLLSCSSRDQRHPQQQIATKSQQVISSVNRPRHHQTINPRGSGLSMQQRFAGVLNAHNRTRQKHNLAPLKWSDKLANYSQEWANHLGRGKQCQMYHRGGQPPFGENLYISSAEVWRENSGREVGREISSVRIKEVVKAWADEEKWYNYQQNSCQPGQQCGHYTQIVWKSTTEVGCAMKVCADKSQTWVCSYNPPGNFVGVRPY